MKVHNPSHDTPHINLNHERNESSDGGADRSTSTSPSSSPEREAKAEARPGESTYPTRSHSRLSKISTNSRTNLMDRSGDRSSMVDDVDRFLPYYIREPRPARGKKDPDMHRIWGGWRVILIGSWLNILLAFIPVAAVFGQTVTNAPGLTFVFCILSLIPLVRLHDLATRELAIRIGGTKTGLLNASMSNIVEIVVAISALRKCELRVVQSSLIGSILTKLLLVLGLCFFAGGMRFSEQDFDATATQIHSSLLSISVGAVLIPVAYHFTLSGDAGGTTSESQKHNLLKMSHGVSIVLLFIYVSYMVFQLWSHTHLYKDVQKSSDRLAVKIPIDNLRVYGYGNKSQNDSVDGTYSPEPSMSGSTARMSAGSYQASPWPYSSASEITLTASRTNLDTGKHGLATPAPAVNPTVKLVQDPERSPSPRAPTPMSSGSRSGNWSYNEPASNPNPPRRGSDMMNAEASNLGSEMKRYEELQAGEEGEPELSWTMTIILLVCVTVTVSLVADWLVESMDGISTTISKEWVALILLPMVSSIAECLTAINVSVKDQMALSISVAVGSTIQTALFVIPFMVTLAWAMGKPLALLFDPFESLVLYMSVQTMSYVVADGKSNWLEGMILICLYVIIAVSFWFYPGSTFSSTLAACSVSG